MNERKVSKGFFGRNRRLKGDCNDRRAKGRREAVKKRLTGGGNWLFDRQKTKKHLSQIKTQTFTKLDYVVIKIMMDLKTELISEAGEKWQTKIYTGMTYQTNSGTSWNHCCREEKEAGEGELRTIVDL